MRTPIFVLALCAFVAVNAPVHGQGNKDKLDRLIQTLQSGSNAERVAAAVALADLGPEAAPAVPALVGALQAKGEDLRLNAAIALGKVGVAAVGPVAKVLTDGDPSDRYYAISALGWIGPAAKSTAPQLIAALADADESVRRKAAYTLGRIDADPKAAVPALVKVLGDRSKDVRQSAADGLSKFGAAAVPALIGALKDDSATLRMEAVRALGSIGGDARDAVGSLKAVFLAGDPEESPLAAEALAKIGKASLPALRDGLKDNNAAIRGRAVQTLGKIGADAVPDLVDALGHKQADVRKAAAAALGPLRIGDKMVVLALAHAVHDPDQRVREQCLHALGFLGAGAKLAAPKLVEALKDSNGQNRLLILYDLRNIGAADKHILPVAAGLLNDGDVNVRIQAIGLLGSKGNAALPHLITALKDADLRVRLAAVNTMRIIPGDIKEALPVLKTMLSETSGFQRRAVVLTIGRVGAPAVPDLINLLKDADVSTRSGAVMALQGIGPDAKKAAPTLSEIALQDGNGLVRRNAVLAIASIEPAKLTDLFDKVKKHPNEAVRQGAYQAIWVRAGKKGTPVLSAKVAMPILIDATKDKSAIIRRVSVQGLGNLGRDAKDAAPAVRALLNDADQNVRTQAQFALKQIEAK